jgi:hypothetical protein
MSRRDDHGNGETCPLFPEHGNMFILAPLAGKPPMQYCSHVIHDGHGGPDSVPRSRKFWPVHGFEESVAAYFARLDKAIREMEVPSADHA